MKWFRWPWWAWAFTGNSGCWIRTPLFALGVYWGGVVREPWRPFYGVQVNWWPNKNVERGQLLYRHSRTLELNFTVKRWRGGFWLPIKMGVRGY